MKVKNWDRWQSYRNDRGQPPWIKVHRCIMRNTEWVTLTDAQKGQLVSIWLLAADRNGVIPDDPKLIQRLCYMTDEPDLTLLIDMGFLDATPTPKRRQRDANMTHQRQRQRQSRDREESDARATRDPVPDWIGQDAWERWQLHCSEIRKPIQPSTMAAQWQRLRKLIDEGHEPADVIDHSIAGGWSSLHPPDKPRSANGNGSHFETPFERIKRLNEDPPAAGDARGTTVEGDAEVVGPDGGTVRSRAVGT